MLPAKEPQQICTGIPRGNAVSSIINSSIYSIYRGIAVAVKCLCWKDTEQTGCSGIPFHIKYFTLRYFKEM